jgi:hypothetical protein
MFAKILPANMLGALTWIFKNHCSYEISNCITFITNLLKSDSDYIGLLNALSRRESSVICNPKENIKYQLSSPESTKHFSLDRLTEINR